MASGLGAPLPGLVSEGEIGGEKNVLLKPETYMNNWPRRGRRRVLQSRRPRDRHP